MTLGSFPVTVTQSRSESTPDEAATLVRRVIDGEADAFAVLYRRYAPLVHGILLSRLPHEEVSDAVQEVFLAAYKNLRGLREPEAIGGWLVRIARNHVVDHYRNRRPADELTEEIRGREDRRAEAAEVLDAIRTLPTAYRETLVLRLVEGMTGAEIAEQTGLSPDSVRVNLHRGMDLLRKKLGIGPRKK